jgi:uncharacterized membrane protein
MTTVTPKVMNRIDLLVADADYPDSATAIADASRVALLASRPEAAAERERVRVAAVRQANERRNPGGPAVRTAGTVERVLFVVAIVLGAVAIGLVALSPRTGTAAFTLESGALLAGIVALVSAGLFIWLEPVRANGELWGSHAPAALHLLFAILWIGFASSVVVFRWDEVTVDAYEPWPVILGLLCFVIAGIIAFVLWLRGRTADLGAGRQTGVAHTMRGLADPADAEALFAALDEWWAQAGPAAEAADREGLIVARGAVLEHLRAAMMIDAREEKKAAATTSFGDWKERRR